MPSVHIANYVDMHYMFNISQGVGKGRANARLDVMLVQYLLSAACNQKGDAVSRIIPPEYAKTGIKADGICGPITLRCIAYYQQFRNENKQHSGGNQFDIDLKVATDGAIDPWKYPAALNINRFNLAGQALDRSSTLVCLCYDAAKSFEFTQMGFQSMPPELKRLLLAH